jgi:hypothetical protein
MMHMNDADAVSQSIAMQEHSDPWSSAMQRSNLIRLVDKIQAGLARICLGCLHQRGRVHLHAFRQLSAASTSPCCSKDCKLSNILGHAPWHYEVETLKRSAVKRMEMNVKVSKTAPDACHKIFINMYHNKLAGFK